MARNKGIIIILLSSIISVSQGITNSGIYPSYPVLVNPLVTQNPLIGGNYQYPPNLAPCGSSINAQFGVTYIIASPGYPSAYQPFSSCQWFFYSTINQPITIDCPNFQLPQSSSTCSNDAFLLFDEGNGQRRWYCGTTGPSNVAFGTNSLNIYFWGSWRNTNNSQGFYCNVRVASSTQTTPGRSCRCGQRQPRNRIVGGVDASINEFPWMALINMPTGLCGGSLINENFVLTAAHCIDKQALPNNALPIISLGEHRISTPSETPYTISVSAKAVWPHENYNRGQGVSFKDYDIGLVELPNPVSLTSTPFIAPVCAPNPLNSYDDVDVIVAGWGFTGFPDGQKSDVLKKVTLKTVPVSTCKNLYTPGIITNRMVCATAPGKDACFDDSGSPLIAYENKSWVIIGVVSFGPDKCATPNVGGVYTRVGDFIPWIKSKVGNSRTCPP